MSTRRWRDRLLHLFVFSNRLGTTVLLATHDHKLLQQGDRAGTAFDWRASPAAMTKPAAHRPGPGGCVASGPLKSLTVTDGGRMCYSRLPCYRRADPHEFRVSTGPAGWPAK